MTVQAVRGWISLGADALVASALGVAATDPARDLIRFRELLASTPAVREDIYPGVGAALAALRDAGVHLAIVTNKPRMLSERLLSDLGLAHRFGAIIGGDSAADSKPYPAPLHMALAAIGGRAASACLVGDSVIDAQAAAAAAIPFYLYGPGYGAAECPDDLVTARFEHFGSLPGMLGCSST